MEENIALHLVVPYPTAAPATAGVTIAAIGDVKIAVGKETLLQKEEAMLMLQLLADIVE
jgi:hypothetical protein